MTTVAATVASEVGVYPYSTPILGYVGPAAPGGPPGQVGSITPNARLGANGIEAIGIVNFGAGNTLILALTAGAAAPASSFTALTCTPLGGSTYTYDKSGATYYAPGAAFPNGTIAALPTWTWADTNADFAVDLPTTLSFTGVITTVTGQGDFTDPESWIDENGNIPPLQYNNVPYNTNYPQNGDGRYWFSVDAESTVGGPINFIGDPGAFVNVCALQWSVVQAATDGSSLVLSYSLDGTNYVSTTIAPTVQLSSIQNGQILVPLAPGGVSALQLYINVTATGGTPSTSAVPWNVALAVTRNVNEQLTWDNPNPYNPVNFNGSVVDTFGIPTATLAALRSRMMIRLGFANQAANPPPGMGALVNDFLYSAQNYLYMRYIQLSSKRKFRWKINPGQRFYSLADSDQDTLSANTLDAPVPIFDPRKRVEWAGIQDTRNVWYPLIQGIPPQLYTMLTKPWRPARYEIRSCIEVYPMPDQTYWLWMEGHMALQPFTADTDNTTLDSELVFLYALANAKAHYGQPDANNIASEADSYRKELVASTHQTAHYIPGTIAVPPAVRPTLIQFDNNPAA